MIRSTLLTFGILLIVTSLLFTGYVASAQSESTFIFGGYIVNSFYCACSGNFLLTLTAPTRGQWLWYPGTPQYREFQLPRTGVWTLGLYTPGGVCLVPTSTSCVAIGNPRGTIGQTVGTSF